MMRINMFVVSFAVLFSTSAFAKHIPFPVPREDFERSKAVLAFSEKYFAPVFFTGVGIMAVAFLVALVWIIVSVIKSKRVVKIKERECGKGLQRKSAEK